MGLWNEAERCLGEQWALTARLTAVEDPKHWFALVYAHVTAAQLEACRALRFPHLDWVLRMVVRFHRYYLDNVERWIDGRRHEVEDHWREAFGAIERPPRRIDRLSGGATQGLVEAVRAHVEGDLPRALAEVYLHHYADRCSYDRFRVDYALMSDVFPRARGEVIEHMPRLVQAVLWKVPIDLREAIAACLHYDIPRQRQRAFERGAQLVSACTRDRSEARA